MLYEREEIAIHIANTLEDLYFQWEEETNFHEMLKIDGKLTALEQLYKNIIGIPYKKR